MLAWDQSSKTTTSSRNHLSPPPSWPAFDFFFLPFLIFFSIYNDGMRTRRCWFSTISTLILKLLRLSFFIQLHITTLRYIVLAWPCSPSSSAPISINETHCRNGFGWMDGFGLGVERKGRNSCQLSPVFPSWRKTSPKNTKKRNPNHFPFERLPLPLSLCDLRFLVLVFLLA